MKIYRSLWRGLMATLVVVSLIAGCASVGWVPVVAVSVGLGFVGAVLGSSLVEDPQRLRRYTGACALWFAIAGVLLLGAPDLARPWLVVAVVALALLSPPLVEMAVRPVRRRLPVRMTARPQRLSDHELECRWRRTACDLRERAGSMADVLALIEERSRLLDEIERRDPEAFDAMLVRAGWREARHT